MHVRAREMTPSHNIIEVFSNDSTRSLQFEHCDAITRFFNISAFLLLHTLQKTHIIIKLCCSRILLFNKAQNQIYELARYGAGSLLNPYNESSHNWLSYGFLTIWYCCSIVTHTLPQDLQHNHPYIIVYHHTVGKYQILKALKIRT